MTTKFKIGATLVLAHSAPVNLQGKGWGGTYDRLCTMAEPFTYIRDAGCNIIVADAFGTETEADPDRFAPFVLKVQSGKTYKTRNGLKVGPMRANHGTYSMVYPFVAVDPDGEETAWLANGGYLRTNPNHKFDLVAEWIEPAVPAAPAIPARPFKVGDKVRFKDIPLVWWFKKGWTGKVTNADRQSSISVLVDSGFSSRGTGFVGAHEIELVAETAYVPKVGDWVKGFGIATGTVRYGTIRRINHSDIALDSGAYIRKDGVELHAAPCAVPPMKTGSFIVVNVAPNGKLAAAANPFIHATQADAEKEALRLSEMIRGQDFRVYSFDHLSTAKAEKPLPAPAGKLVAVGASL